MIVQWLRNPLKGFHRLRFFLWERTHPGLPWLCPSTVRWLERTLTRESRVFEFGSGRSTRWLARNAGKVTSIEHHDLWHATVTRQLAEAGVSADYRLVPLDHPEDEPEREHYSPLPRYVQQIADEPDDSLDLVFVDGHYRTTCIRTALPKIRPGGYLLVDDTNMWPVLPAPAGWSLVHQGSNGVKMDAIWQKPVRGDPG